MSSRRPSQRPPSRDATKAAADWLSRRDAGWTPDDEQAFNEWLAASAEHATAWTELQQTWKAFDRTSDPRIAAEMLRELGVRRRRRRLRAYTLSAVGGLAAILAFVTFQPASPPVAPNASVVARSLITRPAHRTLSDGSVVELNADAEIAVNFTETRRDVRLLRGEALFAVAKNPARPFIVTAGNVTARAVGTQFSVSFGTHETAVLVTEGRVAVARIDPEHSAADATADSVLVEAGRRVSIAADPAAPSMPQSETISLPDQERILAWRGPRLTLSNTPLSEAVAALNRENRTQITIQSEALAQMRLSGVFRADNAEGFVRLLEESYGVRVDRQADKVVLVETRQ